MKTEFEVPLDSMVEFAGIIADYNLGNEIQGTTENNEVTVTVYFDKNGFEGVEKLEELIENEDDNED